MTDITLEQRAVSEALDGLREALPPRPRPGVHETVAIGSTHLLTIYAALAELEAALRLSAGADWVLVPREPTVGMVQSAVDREVDEDENLYVGIYRAMLAAAPRHETGEGS